MFLPLFGLLLQDLVSKREHGQCLPKPDILKIFTADFEFGSPGLQLVFDQSQNDGEKQTLMPTGIK